MRNLRVAAGDVDAPFNGMVFQDSDVYKWLEEAAYALAYQPDAQLQALCDEVVDLIARAQQPDGYLDTPFQIKSGGYARRRRFSQIQQSHEMYVMGHYIEAGVAYWQVTGNEQALQIACRMADCLDANFGDEDGKIPGAMATRRSNSRLPACTRRQTSRGICVSRGISSMCAARTPISTTSRTRPCMPRACRQSSPQWRHGATNTR